MTPHNTEIYQYLFYYVKIFKIICSVFVEKEIVSYKNVSSLSHGW